MVSPEFQEAVLQAWNRAQHNPDPAVRFAAQNVPIYVTNKVTPAQARDAGCPDCTILGLWAAHAYADYPPAEGGYPASNHGLIWLYEDGIRSCAGNLEETTHSVLIHEIDHALQRDHILEAMRKQQPAEAYAWARPRP